MVYVEDRTEEFESPAFVASAFSVVVAAMEIPVLYVVPALHVPGLAAAGELPSVV